MTAVQAHWQWLVATNNPFDLRCWGTLAVFLTVYWCVGLAFLFIDLTDQPAFLVRRRIARPVGGKWRHHLLTKLPALFTNLITNQLVIFVPMALCTGWCARLRVEEALPSLWLEVMPQFLLFVVVEEFLFFASHSLLHHPFLYKHVHKKHHEFKSPTALAAVYAHPAEVLLSNLLPLWGVPNYVHSSLFTWYLWIVVAVIGTQYHHSGYRMLPAWLDHNPDFHDQHHAKFEGNYGLLYGLDLIFQSRCQDLEKCRTNK